MSINHNRKHTRQLCLQMFVTVTTHACQSTIHLTAYPATRPACLRERATPTVKIVEKMQVVVLPVATDLNGAVEVFAQRVAAEVPERALVASGWGKRRRVQE